MTNVIIKGVTDMFCDKCGKEITGDFCSFCETEKITADIYKRKGVNKLSIIIITILLTGLVAFGFIGWNMTKPEKVVKNYISAIVALDYKKVYECIFTNEKLRVEKDAIFSYIDAEEKDLNNKIIFFSISEATKEDVDEKVMSESGATLAYKVIYSTTANPELSTEIVYVVKCGKTLLIFNKYKIYSDNGKITELRLYSSILPKNSQTLILPLFLANIKAE